jgi:hypothetical protein
MNVIVEEIKLKEIIHKTSNLFCSFCQGKFSVLFINFQIISTGFCESKGIEGRRINYPKTPKQRYLKFLLSGFPFSRE